MVSLNDKKAKELAEVISNATSRKILDFLSEKEATATDISKALNIPLSTLNYNLKNLIKNDLIEVKEFKWSPKGREQDIYKVKKKYIVITPGKSEGLLFKEALKKIVPVTLIGLILAGGIEYFTRTKKALQIPFTREVITKTIGEETAMVGEASAGATAALAEDAGIAQDAMTEPIANVTTQVTQTFNEIVLPNPHFGLYFFIGFIIAMLLILIFLHRKTKK